MEKKLNILNCGWGRKSEAEELENELNREFDMLEQYSME